MTLSFLALKITKGNETSEQYYPGRKTKAGRPVIGWADRDSDLRRTLIGCTLSLGRLLVSCSENTFARQIEKKSLNNSRKITLRDISEWNKGK